MMDPAKASLGLPRGLNRRSRRLSEGRGLTSAMGAPIWIPPVYGFLLIKCNRLRRLGAL
jgi:hypothetical protein